jgi:hypothetical protein
MAKRIVAAMLDGGLDKTATCTRLSVLSAEPASIANITTTYKLAASGALTGGSFTKAAGDAGSDSRKVTVAQQSAMSITATGTATHVSLDDGTSWLVTTCTSQALTSGGTVTCPAWKQELGTPT